MYVQYFWCIPSERVVVNCFHGAQDNAIFRVRTTSTGILAMSIKQMKAAGRRQLHFCFSDN